MMDGARARRTPEGKRQKLRKLHRRQGTKFKRDFSRFFIDKFKSAWA
jgi:hypothetical protein